MLETCAHVTGQTALAYYVNGVYTFANNNYNLPGLGGHQKEWETCCL
jgi:hypothetical protein